MSFFNRLIANLMGGRDSKADLMAIRASHEARLEELREKVSFSIEEANNQCAAILAEGVDADAICIQGEHLIQHGKMQLNPCIVKLRLAKDAAVQLMVFHGLPRFPKSPSRVTTFFQLAFAVAADGSVSALQLISAGVFPTAAAALIPVITYASCTTLGAYVVGFLQGRRVFGLNTPEPDLPEFKSVRRTAVFITAFLICAVGWAHLELALMRTQLSLNEIEHSPSAFLKLVSVPEAFFMLLVGALTGLFAYFKGIKNSPYPVIDDEAGNAIDEANDDFDEANKRAVRSITDHFDGALETVKSIGKREVKAIRRYSRLLSKYHNAQERLLNAITSSEGQMRRMTSRVDQVYAAPARGRPRAVQDNADISDFSSFKEDLTLPEEKKTTNYSAVKAQIKTAKLDALTRFETYVSDEISSLSENKYE